MEELQELLSHMLTKRLEQVILSNPVDREKAIKVKIRPVLLKGELSFQETLYKGTQVFHKNCSAQETTEQILDYLSGQFRQAQIKTYDVEATVLISKKGKITIKKRSGNTQDKKREKEHPIEDRKEVLSHNRVKHYILEEGIPVDFLVGLGVQTPDGKVTKAKYDKFRQINRYLEFIEDVLEELPVDRIIRIIDFGCGKSYLTFAMYYYLHELNHRNVRITGLDLKTDVIDRCSHLAEECGYEGLDFEKGDISTYEGVKEVDVVVSLHACDTATDYALAKAVKWGAKVIMAVPCCQHEANKQMKCDMLSPVLKYGVVRERISALITDAVRAGILEQQGYETQILEFIDMEHTPKNLLIRAVKRKGMRPLGREKISEVTEFLHLKPTLDSLLNSTAAQNL